MIRTARPEDVPVILALIHELAAYEKAEHEVEATEEHIHLRRRRHRPFGQPLWRQVGALSSKVARCQSRTALRVSRSSPTAGGLVRVSPFHRGA